MKRLFLFLFPILLLAGCGGGSSGGGPNFTGSYFGTATVTVSGGGITVTAPGTIQFVVSADNTVTVFMTPNSGKADGTGPLTGNTFVVIVPGSVLNDAQLTCSGPINFNGTITGNTMTGNLSASGFLCNGIPFTIRGTFTATLQPQASLTFPLKANSFEQTIKELLRQ